MITLAAVILAVVALLSAVLVRAADVRQDEPAPPVKPDEERRAALEDGLRDLEFEHRVGKLSDRDYEQTRQDMERELAQFGGRAEAGEPRADASAWVCPHCGARFPTPLKFCGECGRPMRRSSP
jgi:cytochrome c-type biogenesis protein CcmI